MPLSVCAIFLGVGEPQLHTVTPQSFGVWHDACLDGLWNPVLVWIDVRTHLRMEASPFVQLAARQGHLDVVRYLCELPVDRGVDPSAVGNDAVQSAAVNGHLNVVRYLCELPVDRGVDPPADDNSAVRLAAGAGHLDVVRYLCELPVDRGVDPSAVGNDAIGSATIGDHLDVVRFLCDLPVDRGVDPSAFAGMVAEQSHRSATARYLCNTYCSGLRLWSRSPVEGIRQQALASLARSPLLVVRAMIRQRRAFLL